MYFDSHTHLNEPRLFQEVKEIIKEAMNNKVNYFMVPSYDHESILRAIELSKRFSNVYATIGIHPSDSKDYSFDILDEIYNLAKSNSKVKAIGEIGLDYYWEKSEEGRNRQKAFFIQQIKLANKLELPIVVHMRDASQETLNIIKEYPPQFGFLMHCYSGSVELMEEIIKLGGYISLGGPVTFLNAKTPKEVALKAPVDRLLIETDAPYLAPHPYRGKTNYPKYLPLINQEIAQIKNMNEDELASITAINAMRFFHVENK